MKNKSLYLNVLLAAALLAVVIHLVKAKSNIPESTEADDEAFACEMDSTSIADTDALTEAEAEPAETQAEEVAAEPVQQKDAEVQPNEKDAKAQKEEAKKQAAEQSAKGDKVAKEEPAQEAAPAEPAKPVVQVINTTNLASDVRGFVGATPLEITVTDGQVTKVKALPNSETPEFMKMVVESGILNKWVGKSVDEARSMSVDAVSGATFTSKAIIENVRRGLREVK